MENETKSEKDPSKQEKKPRKRMKAVLKKIRQQMEFYFSDSNLLKDRFLKKKMDEDADKYVDLEIFLTFNRIRAMTQEIEILRKALSNSALLELNDDKTRVKRTTEIKDPKDVDDRTVYVECLPLGVDHDWVRRVFSACGHVLYVSLPKYRSTGDPKGFAFVEFETVDGAQKACEILNNPPADASDHPGHFPKTSKTLTRLERNLPPKDSASKDNTGKLTDTNHGGVEDKEKPDGIETDEQTQAVKSVNPKKDRKRHRQSSECSSESNDDAVSRKKHRVGDTCNPPPTETDTSEPIKEEKVKYKSCLTREEEEGMQKDSKHSATAEKRTSRDTENSPPKKIVKTESQCDVSSKKAKKRKPRQRKNKEKEVPEIRVISKHNWLTLRNEYIALQKSHMSKLKRSLMAKKQEENAKAVKEKGPKTELVFIAGAIVEVKSEQPLQRSALRAELSKHGDIAYMDMKDGLLQGHIRCVDGQSAGNILQAPIEGCSFRLLEGEEESKYWDKLKLDREHKFSSKTKTKKRGTQKLIDRGERAKADVIQGKHTVFTDE